MYPKTTSARTSYVLLFLACRRRHATYVDNGMWPLLPSLLTLPVSSREPTPKRAMPARTHLHSVVSLLANEGPALAWLFHPRTEHWVDHGALHGALHKSILQFTFVTFSYFIQSLEPDFVA